jgi:hypothetical protein
VSYSTVRFTAESDLTIEFFGNHRFNSAGFAEGEVYLGSVQATTNATGNTTFSLSLRVRSFEGRLDDSAFHDNGDKRVG